MRRLEESLRAVRSRAVTVGRELINHRKFDNAYDPAKPHECACQHYPKEWRRLRHVRLRHVAFALAESALDVKNLWTAVSLFGTCWENKQSH
eukprot:SAG11_NODE_444_length_9421_cov_9.885540_5_plen_91_part_01